MRWLNLAADIARTNDFPGKKLAAVLVTPGGVVCGKNSLKTHPMSPVRQGASKLSNRGARHAEVDAIIKALSRFGHVDAASSLYVARVTKGGRLALAKPCADCQQLIDKLKIRKVFYTV